MSLSLVPDPLASGSAHPAPVSLLLPSLISCTDVLCLLYVPTSPPLDFRKSTRTRSNVTTLRPLRSMPYRDSGAKRFIKRCVIAACPSLSLILAYPPSEACLGRAAPVGLPEPTAFVTTRGESETTISCCGIIKLASLLSLLLGPLGSTRTTLHITHYTLHSTCFGHCPRVQPCSSSVPAPASCSFQSFEKLSVIIRGVSYFMHLTRLQQHFVLFS